MYAADWEESEDIDLDKLERRLVKGNFTGSEISDWHNYMKKAADRAILLKLIARGVAIKWLIRQVRTWRDVVRRS